MDRHLPRNDIGASGSEPRTIGFLLVPGFSLLSYSAAIEPLRAANLLAEAELYRWVHVSGEGPLVPASNGVSIASDAGIADKVNLDAVFVVAGGNPAAFHDAATLAWLRRLARRGVVIGGVSGGPFILAKAGLLDGRRCTLHWMHLPAFLEEFPHLRPSMALFEIDGDRMTCAGGIAALDMMTAMIQAEHGPGLAAGVREWFLQGYRPADQPQRLSLVARHGAHSAPLLRALEAMERRLETPLPRAALARIAGLSVRQLERLFAGQLGATIGDMYRRLRLDRARILVRESTLGITEIATACGFQSASNFSRRYRERFGASPLGERRAQAQPVFVKPRR
ncbi:MAG: GlxA family transcriptional regulator [Bauldia sp.]|nr:GlxA family transcriptional regulator [Bauldia sp.]